MEEVLHKLNIAHITCRLHITAAMCGVSLNQHELMLSKMAKREHDTGMLLCPCQFIADDPVHVLLAVRCPCPTMITDVKRNGKCNCGLFTKKGE